MVLSGLPVIQAYSETAGIRGLPRSPCVDVLGQDCSDGALVRRLRINTSGYLLGSRQQARQVIQKLKTRGTHLHLQPLHLSRQVPISPRAYTREKKSDSPEAQGKRESPANWGVTGYATPG